MRTMTFIDEVNLKFEDDKTYSRDDISHCSHFLSFSLFLWQSHLQLYSENSTT